MTQFFKKFFDFLLNRHKEEKIIHHSGITLFSSTTDFKPIYRVTVKDKSDIYDGDTFRGDIHLTENLILQNISMRFAIIDAPEIRGEERPQGLIARDALRNKMEEQVYIKMMESGKYGRPIVFVYNKSDEVIDDKLSLNQWMLDNNYAQLYQ